jgi:diguanylate cyclase (GGDEF)-like protein
MRSRTPDATAPVLRLAAGERWALDQVRRRGVGAFVGQLTLVAVVGAVLLIVVALLIFDGFDNRAYWIRSLVVGALIPAIVGPPILLLSARLVAHLDTASRLLQESAVVDPLTGVANRRGFFAALESLEHSGEVEVAMVDVDDFKSINDEYGHAAGDTALCLVAAWLEELVGDAGTVGRLGGDEFAFVATVDERRGAPARHDFRLDDIVFSASIGRAVANDGQVHAALAEADADLYHQKRSRPAPVRRIVRSDQRGGSEE